MKRIILFSLFTIFLFSCTPEDAKIDQQALDSLAAQGDEVDTFSVEKNRASTTPPQYQSSGNNKKSAPDFTDTSTISNTNTATANSTDIVITPDVYPLYPGGELVMQQFIKANLKYPLVAFQNEIKGIVTVKFVVETDGSLTGITVAKGLGYGCDESAVDLIRKMPKWTPGRKDGVNVRCKVILPLYFGG